MNDCVHNLRCLAKVLEFTLLYIYWRGHQFPKILTVLLICRYILASRKN